MSTVARRNHQHTRAATEVKRAEVVRLRLAGHTLDAIADQLGCSEGTVRYHQRGWLDSVEPPAERAHELRETWGGRLEAAHARIWPQVEEGDPKAIEVMLKIQQQFARLFGLELQPGLVVGVFTAEAMASAFGWDHDAEAVEESVAPAQITESAG